MKIAELKSALLKHKIDIALFYNINSLQTEPNFFYFTGYEGIGALVIPKNKEEFLLVPKMEYEKARVSRIKIYCWDKKRLFESIKECIVRKNIPINVIGIDYSNFTISAYKSLKKSFGCKTRDISGICRELRIIKTPVEIEYIKKGCEIADRVFQEVIERMRNFQSETEIASLLEYKTKSIGLEMAFKPIIASGKSSSIPHYFPKNIKLKRGFCVIDFGVRFNGYCTDMSRTIYIGTPTEYEKKMYDLILNVQKTALKSIKGGTESRDVCVNVNKLLGKYAKYFIHGLGHGIGVEIHEAPNLKADSKDTLQNNMVFTIEPGIYFPNKFGIRIEDTVVLIEGKISVLTKSKKGLLLK